MCVSWLISYDQNDIFIVLLFLYDVLHKNSIYGTNHCLIGVICETAELGYENDIC